MSLVVNSNDIKYSTISTSSVSPAERIAYFSSDLMSSNDKPKAIKKLTASRLLFSTAE